MALLPSDRATDEPPRTLAPDGEEAARRADQRLVERALAGDETAVAALLERLVCAPRIVRALNRRLPRPLGEQDCEDAVQEALTSIWVKLATYRPERRLEAWVYGFCSLQLRKQLEARDRSERVELRAEGEDWAGNQGPRLEPSFEYELVHAGLDGLAPRTAQIVRMRHFGGLTFHEIARRVVMPVSSAKTLYYRGLASLRVFLGPSQREERVR